MARLVLVAYPPDDPLGTPAGTLSSAYETSVTVEDDGIGAGSFALHPDDADAAWCVQDVYIAVWRDTVSGDPLAGFWIDALTEVVLSPDEGGGRELRVAGQGPIAILDEALVWPRAVSGGDAVVQRAKGRWRWKDAHPARVLVRLLEEATERGCLPGVTWDFSRYADSDGTAWSDDAAQRFTVPIGSSLLDVVRELRETGLAVTMTPGLVLRAWEDHGRDLTGSIAFTAGVDIRETAESAAAARRGRSHVVVEGEDADEALRYRVVRDPAIAAALGRRKEGFFRYTRTATPAVLERVGRRKLRRWQRRHDGPFVLPVIDTPGQVALIDYTAGDTVAVPTAFAAAGSERIAAITLTEGEDGSYEVTLEFGDVAPDATSGRSYGGDTAGQDCCRGAGGAGDKPGSGGGSGGGSTATVTDSVSTEPLILTDFACTDGHVEVIGSVVAAEVGTDISLPIPDGADIVDRYLLVLLAWDERASVDPVTAMVGEGFEAIEPGETVDPDIGSKWFWKRIAAGEYPASGASIELSLGASANVVGFVELQQHVYDTGPGGEGPWWGYQPGTTADPVATDPGFGEGAFHRWFAVLVTDGSPISGDPVGYAPLGEAAMGDLRLRVTARFGTDPVEDPSAFAASGAHLSYTFAERGGCSYWPVGGIGALPRQDDTAAWWPGGNVWDVNADSGYGSTIAIVDGVLTITQGPTYASRQLAVRGTSHDEAALPMEVDDWEIEVRYRRGGQEAPLTGDQSLAFTWAGSYLGGILFDHPAYGPCVRVVGDGMDTLTKTLTPLGEWGRIKARRLDGILSAKEWAEAADEPDWEVSTPASDLEEPDDVFRLLTNFGAASGAPMTLEVDWIRVIPIVSSGATVSRVLAHGDGTGPFALGEPFTPGTLRVTVDDRPVTPSTQSASAGTFSLAAPVYHDPAGHPAGCAVMRVTVEKA